MQRRQESENDMEVDEYDHDSTFGGDRDSIVSSSVSLNSAITKYQFEHGRRYHAYQAGAYSFPNDEQELNRMDIEHQNQKIQMDGQLHLCPLHEPEAILDLGTGTGIWAMEMADQYPTCEVVGTDLSPVQPSWVPVNCSFEVDDFELEWTWGENRFDMIHHRFSLGSVSDYPRLYKQAYAALKPGGWIEIIDMEAKAYSDDDTLPEDSPLVAWGKLIEEAFAKIGKPFLKIEEYPRLLKEQGFENIQSHMIKRPSNDWPKDPKMKEIGRVGENTLFCCLNFLEGLEGFTMAPFTRVLGWKQEEVKSLIAKVRAETVQRSVHAWQKAQVILKGEQHFQTNL
ncbi:S-adenosyl-L-methionine-dependent methyltransferase [Acrodontium crateriforme]|uniref:S-adenosyl-L-methionine-dependent methyltransferase n=1 Tax=Acrodontium crateriforme TaxID=150365 RepID=A0AAQ3RA59_9PEZI|nr:S-adenosyl-L-methionine-dependent methyltransferase [Acrodontium crateriforme]